MVFLNISISVWGILAVSVILALGYARLMQGKNGKDNSTQRSLAVLTCIGIALVATVISKYQTYVGAPMLGLIMGILLVNLIPEKKMSAGFRAGAAFSAKAYLSLGIVLLGATLSFKDLFGAVYALPLILFNMLLAFSVSFLVGRKLLGVSANVCSLVGSGTCVCGGTAIAAVSPIIKAKEEETAYAMTAIFLFDLLACLSYPYLASAFDLSAVQFGFLAGTAINDTSSVVAAQETYAALTGMAGYAMPATIKVVRTTMILVLALIFSVLEVRKELKSAESAIAGQSIGNTVWKAVPKFILVFIVMIALNSLLVRQAADTGFYSSVFKPFFSNSYKFMVTVALTGAGFKIKFRDLFTKGLKPIVLGGCTWLALFISSFVFSTFIAEKLL